MAEPSGNLTTNPFLKYISQEKFATGVQFLERTLQKFNENQEIAHTVSTLAFAALLYYVDALKPLNLLLAGAGIAAQKMYNEHVFTAIDLVHVFASKNDTAKVILMFAAFAAASWFPSKVASFCLGYYAAGKFFVKPPSASAAVDT